jgi:hypothetical protein
MQGFAEKRSTLAVYDDRLALRSGGVDATGSRARPVPLGSAARSLDGLGGLGWSVVGFVLGAVFWHFVGFWGFVSDVVLSGEPSAFFAAQPRGAAAGVRTEIAAVSSPLASCISLALDRRTGLTSATACDGPLGPLSTDPFEGREDRAARASPSSGRGALERAPSPQRAIAP